MEQRSEEWFAARLGKLTASRVADALATTAKGWGAGRKNYAAELLCERLTGAQQERFTNAAMAWGTETEPQARAAYEFMRDVTVEEVGFVPHPSIPMSGASPDGLVGDDGLIEIKCPNTATHIETLLSGKIEQKYLLQMRWQMACTGRLWCDFVSFDPRLPVELQMWVSRVERPADDVMEDFERQIREFLAELDATEAALRSRYMAEAA